ncbi:molybdopterin molybdenumtransferase MoeA [Gracilaria domingensis]|nr:molybdopterin molybdenumtransferase MoeA [Gracilaria domingensis]
MAPSPERSRYPLLPMDQALEKISATLSALPITSVPTAHALHRLLAVDVHASRPHPPFRASVKDGYAVTIPLAASLRVIASSHAGSNAPLRIATGTAAYVATGAPIPEGADAVVMVEHCLCEGDELTFTKQLDLEQGHDIREIGCDVAAGELVLSEGTYLGAAEIGILASCCVTFVEVYDRPVIGVFSSGDEILDVNKLPENMPYGSIIDCNRPMLLASVQEALPFCTPLDLGVVPDSESVVTEALREAIKKCHIVITTGGVSMGRRDFIKPVLEKIATVHFGRVLMKPGKPLTYATMSEHRCFLALPGNPVSCFVCFHLAVAVAARKLAGWKGESVNGVQVDVTIAHDIKLDKQRPEYHRATLQSSEQTDAFFVFEKHIAGQGYVGTSTGKQASSRLLSTRSADALLMLPKREGSLSAGTTGFVVLQRLEFVL